MVALRRIMNKWNPTICHCIHPSAPSDWATVWVSTKQNALVIVGVDWQERGRNRKTKIFLNFQIHIMRISGDPLPLHALTVEPSLEIWLRKICNNCVFSFEVYHHVSRRLHSRIFFFVWSTACYCDGSSAIEIVWIIERRDIINPTHLNRSVISHIVGVSILSS